MTSTAITTSAPAATRANHMWSAPAFAGGTSRAVRTVSPRPEASSLPSSETTEAHPVTLRSPWRPSPSTLPETSPV
ncbi:hypothetical protein PQR15_02815 [Streptomyces lydicus]|nr:hypothetical protein [Streptomyces lydicus]